MPGNRDHALFRSRGRAASQHEAPEVRSSIVKLSKDPEMRVKDGKSYVYLYGDGRKFVIYGVEGERDTAAITATYASKGDKVRIESRPDPDTKGWEMVLSITDVK